MMLPYFKKQWIKNRSKTVSRRFWTRFHNLFARNRISISGERNLLDTSDALLLNVQIDVAGSDNTIRVAENCVFSSTLIRVRGNHHTILIGANCTYQGGELWVEDHDCTLSIGEGTTVVEAHIAVTEPGSVIEIGPDCMFAHGIELRCGDSHSIIDLTNGKRINYAKNIRLGKHIWVASDAMILKGVEIGDDCVIASRSLVTKSFAKNTLIGGSPAAALKENITWDRKRIYDQEKSK
jgi:acetyltransferase-like isoleucine patch superfamily enzyme